MSRFNPRYSIYELAERKAANAIGRERANNNKPKKTKEELLAFIFGGANIPSQPNKTPEAITQSNKEKYSVLSKGFCTIHLKDGTHYNGRFSKLENSKTNVVQNMSLDTSVHFYDCKVHDYTWITLQDIVYIKANKETWEF